MNWCRTHLLNDAPVLEYHSGEDSYIELGGSIPVLGGTVGVDFLVSPENGIKGFTLSFGLKADIPEVHVGGGN